MPPPPPPLPGLAPAASLCPAHAALRGVGLARAGRPRRAERVNDLTLLRVCPAAARAGGQGDGRGSACPSSPLTGGIEAQRETAVSGSLADQRPTLTLEVHGCRFEPHLTGTKRPVDVMRQKDDSPPRGLWTGPGGQSGEPGPRHGALGDVPPLCHSQSYWWPCLTYPAPVKLEGDNTWELFSRNRKEITPGSSSQTSSPLSSALRGGSHHAPFTPGVLRSALSQVCLSRRPSLRLARGVVGTDLPCSEGKTGSETLGQIRDRPRRLVAAQHLSVNLWVVPGEGADIGSGRVVLRIKQKGTFKGPRTILSTRQELGRWASPLPPSPPPFSCPSGSGIDSPQALPWGGSREGGEQCPFSQASGYQGRVCRTG